MEVTSKRITLDWQVLIHRLFFFQAEDGIRVRSPSRGLGDVYKRQDYQGIYKQCISRLYVYTIFKLSNPPAFRICRP